MDAETWHNLAILSLRIGSTPLEAFFRWLYPTKPNPVTIAGITFPNKVGLAAGFDKNAVAFKALSALGFGHIEVGTITKLPHAGNPRPRIFKMQNQTLVNSMGLPNCGSTQAVENIQEHKVKGFILGVSVAKTQAEGAEEYPLLVGRFSGLVDYITINISCPNILGTTGFLRDVHEFKRLLKLCVYQKELLGGLRPTPLFVKLPGNLNLSYAGTTVKIIEDCGIDGIIATNSYATSKGGMSGGRLLPQSLRVFKAVRRCSKLPLIGCGGILSVEDGRRYIEEGADLVQIYSGFIFRGPSFPSKLVNNI